MGECNGMVMLTGKNDEVCGKMVMSLGVPQNGETRLIRGSARLVVSA